MLTLVVDKDFDTKSGMCNYLRDVARAIDEGYTSGEGWELTGEEEPDIEPEYEEGNLVKVAEDNDNSCYDSFRGKVLRVVKVSVSTEDHPGFDESVGQALYDLEALDGTPVNCSLYDYELEPSDEE